MVMDLDLFLLLILLSSTFLGRVCDQVTICEEDYQAMPSSRFYHQNSDKEYALNNAAPNGLPASTTALAALIRTRDEE